MARVHSALAAIHTQGLNWALPTVRHKLLPALIEWDVQHPQRQDRDAGEDFGGAGSSSSRGGAAWTEFRPGRVVKVQGGGHGWRFVVEWSRSEADVEGLGALPPAQRRKPQGDALPWASHPAVGVAEWDRRWLKEVDAEHRAARRTALRRHWPALLAEWEQK